MSQITTIGLDLAKSVFHVVGFTDRGNEKMKKALRRKQVLLGISKRGDKYLRALANKRSKHDTEG